MGHIERLADMIANLEVDRRQYDRFFHERGLRTDLFGRTKEQLEAEILRQERVIKIAETYGKG